MLGQEYQLKDNIDFFEKENYKRTIEELNKIYLGTDEVAAEAMHSCNRSVVW